MRTNLSIIIVNYQSRMYLEKCLASIYAKISSRVSFEIIIINNDLQEDVVGLEAIFPEVRIIQNSRNNGFGGANNLGAKEMKGEILFFLNPDAEIVSDNISLILKQFRDNPILGVLGSRLIAPNGKVQKWSAGSDVNLWSILKNNLKLSWDKKYWYSQKTSEVSWVAGTALFIRQELFFQLGGFDERFFLYFEDVDFCKRARNLGKKVVYFPQFSILHHGGKSFSLKESQKKSYYQSQDYYFRKHFGFFQSKLLKILRFFSF